MHDSVKIKDLLKPKEIARLVQWLYMDCNLLRLCKYAENTART